MAAILPGDLPRQDRRHLLDGNTGVVALGAQRDDGKHPGNDGFETAA
jgi:hypothetical protein